MVRAFIPGVSLVKRSSMVLLLLGLAVAALAATGAQAGRTSAKATTVNYATSFGNFGRDAYVYVAIENGYFKDAGFDVKVTNGTGSLDNIKLVAAGRLDYAPADIGALVVAKANENIPVKLTSVIHQSSPSAFFTLADSGITTFKGLEGKTIADAPGATTKAFFPILAKRAGVDASKVTFREAAPPALPALLASKQVDAIGQFVIGVPLIEKAVGDKKLRLLRFSQVLPNLLGIGIVASEQKISSNPTEVKAFNRALLKGLQWAIDNPGRAGWILKKHNPLADPIVAANELRLMKSISQNKLTRTKGYGIGYIDLGKVASTISIVRSGFKIEKPIPLTDVYTTAAVPAKKQPKR